MSDYNQAVSDEKVFRLTEAIEKFADDVNQKLDNQTATVNGILSKQYTVNHEPKIELPFEAEYKYIHDGLNSAFADKGGLDKFAHIFISGYLPNGKTIRVDNEDAKFDSVYVNGVRLTENYTCRAEEDGIEKLNIMVVQQLGGNLVVDYTDIPLKGFKMIVFDDVGESIKPNINSFLESQSIDTLKVIGSLRWTSSELCTLRRLEVTKDLIAATIDCPCLQELIIPNSTDIPVLNSRGQESPSLIKIDISNVGNVGNISGANLSGDLNLNCVSLKKITNNGIDTVSTGNKCTSVAIDYNMANKLICGANITLISKALVSGYQQQAGTLKEIVFKNVLPLTIQNWALDSLQNTLQSITFSELAAMSTITNSNNVVKNLAFTAPLTEKVIFSTSPNLTEQSVLNVINALDTDSKVNVSFHRTTKLRMQSSWYCKLKGSEYVSCESDDEGAVTQESALVTKGGTLQ